MDRADRQTDRQMEPRISHRRFECGWSTGATRTDSVPPPRPAPLFLFLPAALCVDLCEWSGGDRISCSCNSQRGA